MSAVQLPLGIRLDDGATFRNYLAGTNAEALHLARAALNGRERFVYFWGGPGTGKTHLLQALCHEAAQCGAPTAYLPFAHKDELAPELLEGMEHLAAVCCDDVQCIAGHGAWERALFDLYNRVRESGAALVMTGSAPPPRLGIRLADLQSRLGWGVVVQLHPLGDEDKVRALTARAARRGLELSNEVGQFLLRRFPRDMGSLFAVLERLDNASWEQKRRITIPFVREVIGS